jgi:hypothetical protein
MLTIKNYFSEIKDIDWASMPEALSKGHNLVVGASQNNWSAYNTNENIKRVVDAYFYKLGDYIKKNASTKAAKALPEKAIKTSSKPASKPKPQPKPSDEDEDNQEATPIERIDTDVQFIKRYASMHFHARQSENPSPGIEPIIRLTKGHPGAQDPEGFTLFQGG